MKKSLPAPLLLLTALCALIIASSAPAAPMDSGFSYQGRLYDGGVPAGGLYDLRFVLRDQPVEGVQIGTEVALDAVVVTNGLFQVTLNFGTNVFDGTALWLDVSVRNAGSQGTFTLLTPSQKIQPVPYTIHAIKAGQLVGILPGNQLEGSYSNALSLQNAGNAFAGSGAGLRNLNGTEIMTGTVADARIAATLARDSELFSVSNSLSGQISSEASGLATALTVTSNGLSGRLEGTNASLVTRLVGASNVLQTAIGNEAAARAALATQLATGDNVFSGSNVFTGFVIISNQASLLFGNGAGLTNLDGSMLSLGTIPDERISSAIARVVSVLGLSNQFNQVTATLFSSNALLAGAITTASNGLGDRLVATNTALVTLVTDSSNSLNTALAGSITTTSNSLHTALGDEAAARAALATKLATASNNFAGTAVLTNVNNVIAGNGSGLTALNGSQISSGTVADARIAATLARDSELLSVSNSLSGQITSEGTTLSAAISATTNGLSSRLVNTNAALSTLIANSSNALQTAIDNEASARGGLATQLATGSNNFAGVAVLTNQNNVMAGNGSGLTALNGSQISSGTVADARIAATLTRDSELLSASNSLSGQLSSQGTTLSSAISATTNGLSNRLVDTNTALTTLIADSSNALSGELAATNTALVGRINSSSNSLQTAIGDEVAARSALATQLQSGANTFAGSNHFSGIVTLTNATNVIAGNGAALTALNAGELTSGTIPLARMPTEVLVDIDGSVSTEATINATRFSGGGSSLTGLNASSLGSGTVPDARLDAGITRDTELNSVSNSLSGELSATNTALVGLINSSSNSLQTSISDEVSARSALATQLQTGANTFAGSNHFSGIVVLTNATNELVGRFTGDGSGLTNIPTSLLTGIVTSDQLSGTYSKDLTFSGANVYTATNRFSGVVLLTNGANEISGNGVGLTNLAGVWLTGGNNGTSADSDFIGTTDNQALEVKVEAKRALRFEPGGSDSAPNLVGGSYINTVDSGVYGAVIAGGGQYYVGDGEIQRPNKVVSGGDFSFIGAGRENTNSSSDAVIGGGSANLIATSSYNSVIGGGNGNVVTNRYATVPGGANNRAGGQYSFAAGRRAKADADGTFVWADSQSADFQSTTADSFNVRARGGMNVRAGTGTIALAGGSLTFNGNDVLTNGQGAVLTSDNSFTGNNVFSSGSNHFSGIVTLTNGANAVSGDGAGLTNLSGVWKTGGNSGTTAGTDFIGTADGQPLEFKVNGGRVLRLEEGGSGAPNVLGGSSANTVGSGLIGATIAGGGATQDNEVEEPNVVNSNFGTVGGGKDNSISSNSIYSTIAGGRGSSISAGAQAATIGGGQYNSVTTNNATVPGGYLNRAGGQYSFAAGRRAQADADGAFVWADSQSGAFQSTVADSFNVRARGGLNVQASSSAIALVGGSLTFNGHDVLTNGQGAVLTADNTFSGGNTFTASNHYSGVLTATNTTNVIAGDGSSLTGLWRTAGNSGTSPGSDFFGTTDNQDLLLKANNKQIARFTPAPDEGAPNILLGAEINVIGSGVFGATVSGGGASDFMHEGSEGNTVNANYSSIGGGVANLIDFNGYAGTIGGGYNNQIGTNADRAVIAGGSGNQVDLNAYAGAIGGGSGNYVGSGANYATVAGGQNNSAVGLNATVAGGKGNNLTSSADYSAVAGGDNNDITGGKYSFIGGGQNNTVSSSDKSTVVGGIGNSILSAPGGFVGGGYDNAVANDGNYWAFVGGGAHNNIKGGSDSAAIVGGQYNTNSGTYGLIGAGYYNQNSGHGAGILAGRSNEVEGVSAVIGGGDTNVVSANYSAIVGGLGGSISGEYSFIGAGRANVVGGSTTNTVIGGGDRNKIGQSGGNNVIGGGAGNVLGNGVFGSTIGGGATNQIGSNAEYSTVPGGAGSQANADYSLAAGRRAIANHQGAFVWADSTDADFTSTANNEFRARANGGFVFDAGNKNIEFTTSGNLTLNGIAFQSGGQQQPASDRNKKKNFTELDTREVLEKLAAIPITRWNYKTEDDRHWTHIGPMVQDVNPAFFPGREDLFISTLEYGGVSLAAIQGLNLKLEEEVKAKDRELESLRDELRQLRSMVEEIRNLAR